jgi:hypothetical protein
MRPHRPVRQGHPVWRMRKRRLVLVEKKINLGKVCE